MFEQGQVWVLITTDVLARGIDFPDLKLVINFDVPISTVSYVHRVGRTGRAHKVGKAITLFTKDDQYVVRKLADLLKNSGCDVPEWIFSIKKKDKRYFKHLEKKPIKRDNIDRSRKIKKDGNFHAEIKKRDYQFYKK